MGLGSANEKKLEEILKKDNVIVEGRSAFMLLNRKDVVKIFLNTPIEDRIKHVASRRGIPLENAREDVKNSDQERNHLMQRLFGKDALDITNYNLSVDTSSKTFSKVAGIIAETLKASYPTYEI